MRPWQPTGSWLWNIHHRGFRVGLCVDCSPSTAGSMASLRRSCKASIKPRWNNRPAVQGPCSCVPHILFIYLVLPRQRTVRSFRFQDAVDAAHPITSHLRTKGALRGFFLPREPPHQSNGLPLIDSGCFQLRAVADKPLQTLACFMPLERIAHLFPRYGPLHCERMH